MKNLTMDEIKKTIAYQSGKLAAYRNIKLENTALGELKEGCPRYEYFLLGYNYMDQEMTHLKQS